MMLRCACGAIVECALRAIVEHQRAHLAAGEPTYAMYPIEARRG